MARHGDMRYRRDAHIGISRRRFATISGVERRINGVVAVRRHQHNGRATHARHRMSRVLNLVAKRPVRSPNFSTVPADEKVRNLKVHCMLDDVAVSTMRQVRDQPTLPFLKQYYGRQRSASNVANAARIRRIESTMLADLQPR